MLELWNKEYYTEVGDECKRREVQLSGTTEIAPTTSFVIRVDGRAFHTFTKGLTRPFSQSLRECMKRAATEVMKHLGAQFAYFQSDEITYGWTGKSIPGYVHPFNGRVDKLLSVVASLTSVAFYKAAVDNIPNLGNLPLPHFDARLADLVDTEHNSKHSESMLIPVMWRENDAIRNSIAMVAQSMFTPTELHGLNVLRQRQSCTLKGYDWESPIARMFVQGTYLVKQDVMVALTDEELEHIPEHRRPEPGHTFSRSTIVEKVFDSWDVDHRASILLTKV